MNKNEDIIFVYVITLNTGTNVVVVTLTELTTITPAYYLFAVTSRQTNSTKYFTASDTSSFTSRYNKFTITLLSTSTGENLNNGTIYLPNEGYYSYQIYQQGSPTNLDPANTSGIVEYGDLKVSYSAQSLITYPLSTQEIKVYGE